MPAVLRTFERDRRIEGVTLGLVVGVVFSSWNLLMSAVAPLSEDSLPALAVFYGPMFAIWGIAGFVAARRSRRLTQAVKVAATVAFVTFVVFDAAAFVRVNLFLDDMTRRADWQNMMASYRASGFESLRAYVNYEYLKGAPFKILTASSIGAIVGLIGGLIALTVSERHQVASR